MAKTVFIAVQCFECRMMQVKQQKKSSNKWTCVVCNQKQSVRKVFAQGYMAKDLRQFVQSFNMSQKDQQGGGGFESRVETEMPNKKPKLCANGAESDTGDGGVEANNTASKWSKYMSEDDMSQKTFQRALDNAGPKWHEFMVEDEDEKQRTHRPMTVKDVSKWNNYFQDNIKPRSFKENVAKAPLKWDDYLTEDEGQQRTPRPTMAMGASKLTNCLNQDDKEPMPCQEKAANASSKWDDYMTEEDEVPTTQQPRTTDKSASKWKSYLTQEDDELQLVSGRKFADHNSEWRSNGDFEIISHDHMVEDDIHPDFI